MEALYRSHDVLVFPSLCESFGLPLVEAAIHGLAIVASDLDFAREVLGRQATFASPSASRSWVDAIERITYGGSAPSQRLPGNRFRTWRVVAEELANALTARLR
jgi:glycosyltransferase involved in cell wall biosynthesis